MNNIVEILLRLPLTVWEALLYSVSWAQDHLERTVTALRRALFFNFVLLGCGVLIARIGYGVGFEFLISIGRFVCALSTLVAAGLLLNIYVRMWVLGQVAVIANYGASYNK